MKRSGSADLPLHTGTVPRWLADRMKALAGEIVEAMILSAGPEEVLVRLSDPMWFQCFGAVLGMDWHSSGITTSVLYALKRAVAGREREWGLAVCGGRGRFSRRTPEELVAYGGENGLDAAGLVRASRLCAKVDSAAVQDGFQLYQHVFVVSRTGEWTVVQQGMNPAAKAARRYHWRSAGLRSFVEEPHAGVVGENEGEILNLTAKEAERTRGACVALAREKPEKTLKEVAALSKGGAGSQLLLFGGEELSGRVPTPRDIALPGHHDVRREDVDLKRLGAVLATAYEAGPEDFAALLLTPGLGERTLQALTLVGEVVYGTPGRFRDPARFSFAHGGKDAAPFPVPTRVYDESIRVLRDAIEESKLGYREKSDTLRRLHETAKAMEERCEPEANFDALLAHEWRNTRNWGGRTVSGPAWEKASGARTEKRGSA
jgi:hypothetical protein